MTGEPMQTQGNLSQRDWSVTFDVGLNKVSKILFLKLIDGNSPTQEIILRSSLGKLSLQKQFLYVVTYTHQLWSV